MSTPTKQLIDTIYKKTGYHFLNPEHLVTALTHKSIPAKSRLHGHNERMEFLGDAILQYIITDELYKKFSWDEGFMTTVRSRLVSKVSLAQTGREMDLDQIIIASHSQFASITDSIVADTFEALLGAIYLDGGLTSARQFIQSILLPKLTTLLMRKQLRDPKTLLQEILQSKHKLTPKYKTISAKGKDHAKTFECAVYLGGKLLAKGEGLTKQVAESEAAAIAIRQYEQPKFSG
jgi:ribonuclease III